MSRFSPKDLLRDLDRAVHLFKKYDLDYVLIGGLVLGVWGRPRTTVDLDFLILVAEEGMRSFKTQLSQEGLKIDRTWTKWNPLLGKSHLRVQGDHVVIDLMIPRDAHEREIFKQKKRKKLEGKIYNVVGPEDFILQKLKVGRPHDFEDALTVLQRMRGNLDWTYLHRWAKDLGLLKELNYMQRL